MKIQSLFGIRGKRMRVPIIMPFVLGGLVFLGPGGCNKDEPSPSPVKKVVRVPKRMAPGAQKKETSPGKQSLTVSPGKKASEEAELLEYQLRLLRDPFHSFIVVKSEGASPSLDKMQSEKKILTPLQRYGLDQLKVVGIVAGGKDNRALMEDDVGKGYVVSVGDDVGNQGGKIVAIKHDRVLIEESYRDPLGKKKTREITKRLYAADAGGR